MTRKRLSNQTARIRINDYCLQFCALCIASSLAWTAAPHGICAPLTEFKSDLTNLEQTVFGQSHDNLALEPRLKALETSVFGSPQTGNAITRIQALKALLIPPSTHTIPPEELDSGTAKTMLRAGISAATAVSSISSEARKNFGGRWIGTLSGNDPHVNAELFLNCSDDRITGTFDWTSAMSGTNRRALRGFYEPTTGAVILKDDCLLSAMPVGNWRFCPVDRYELRLANNGQTLSGRYWSSACSDRGTLCVRKVEESNESPTNRR
jgi:hypothetical protein